MKNLILILTLLPFISHSQSEWYEIEVPTNENLSSVYFIDSAVGYIGGDSVLLKTIDGGTTWNTMNLVGALSNGINYNTISDMHWFSADHGIICQSPNSAFFETTDGGESWAGVPIANAGFCQSHSLFFFDENNGFAGGAGCFQGELIDRFDGEWNSTLIPDSWDPGSHINEIEFIDSEIGFAVSTGGLFSTIDGGFTWNLVPGLPEFNFTDIVFDSPTDLYMTYEGAQWGVLGSTDGGQTWGENIPCATFYYPNLYAAHKAENNLVYFGGVEGLDGTQGFLLEKEGESCSYQLFDQTIQDINSHSDAVFFVGDSGMVYTNNFQIANKVEQLKAENQTLLYPNPCSQQVTIEKSENEVAINIVLYDTMGKEVFHDATTSMGVIQLYLPALAHGMYTLQINFKTRIEQHQLLID